jgi:hypothetical protein
MRAAEDAIDRLQKEADKAVRAAAWRTMWIRVLNVAVGVLILACVLLGYIAYRGHQLVDTVQSGAITSCQSGNVARGTNQKIWDEFLTVLVTDPTIARTRTALENDVAGLGLSPAEVKALDDIIVANWSSNSSALKLVHGFEDYIAAHEKQQHCQQIYGARAAS